MNYRHVRCDVAHAYHIEGNGMIIVGNGPCGVEYDKTTDHYTSLLELT